MLNVQGAHGRSRCRGTLLSFKDNGFIVDQWQAMYLSYAERIMEDNSSEAVRCRNTKTTDVNV